MPVILGMDPASGGVMIYANLEGQIEAGHKKAPKIYHAAVHPTRCAPRSTGCVHAGVPKQRGLAPDC